MATTTNKTIRRFDRIVRMAELSARLNVEYLKVNVNDYEAEHIVSITSKNGGDDFWVELYDGLIIDCKHFPTSQEAYRYGNECVQRDTYEGGYKKPSKRYNVSLTHIEKKIYEILSIWGREGEVVR